MVTFLAWLEPKLALLVATFTWLLLTLLSPVGLWLLAVQAIVVEMVWALLEASPRVTLIALLARLEALEATLLQAFWAVLGLDTHWSWHACLPAGVSGHVVV